jgi:hypothetical protein
MGFLEWLLGYDEKWPAERMSSWPAAFEEHCEEDD